MLAATFLAVFDDIDGPVLRAVAPRGALRGRPAARLAHAAVGAAGAVDGRSAAFPHPQSTHIFAQEGAASAVGEAGVLAPSPPAAVSATFASAGGRGDGGDGAPASERALVEIPLAEAPRPAAEA
jgi:hypothetical protein